MEHLTPEELEVEQDAQTKYSMRSLGNYLVITFDVPVLDMIIGTRIKNSILRRMSSFNFIDVIIDMRNIVSIDSTGLSLLAFILNKTKKDHLGKVYIYKISDKLFTILKLASMTSFFNFIDDAGLEELKKKI